MSASHLEERVSAFVDDLLHVEAVEESFNQFIVHRPDLEAAKLEQQTDEWLAILSDSSGSGDQTGSSQADQALKYFVTAVGSPVRPQSHRVEAAMVELLEKAVARRVVGARQVCDAVLTSDYLKPDRTSFWVASFGLVRRIIGGVDYKGVREIMKICIDKVLAMPKGQPPEPQMTAVHNLLEYIFDRNAALLPGYFIVNEILKSYPENPMWPHWTLVPMVSAFLNSFRPTAQMVSSILRHKMRPVVEQTGKAHVVSTWKMDPHNLKFLLKGSLTYDRILPYSKDLVEPQRDLLLYILRQLYSKELVNNVMGVQKPRKDPATGVSQILRYPMLEEQLIALFVAAMHEAEDEYRQKGSASNNTLLLWWNITSELIFFLLYQFVSFPSFVEGVHTALVEKGTKLRVGRDHLMWTLLQFISGSIAKTTTTDFMPVLKLLSLYDEPEPLAVPDITKRCCTRKLAAAGIYIHLAKKCQGADSASSKLYFGLPVALRKHHSFLRQLASQEVDLSSSLQKDFLTPLLCNTFSTAQDIFQVFMSDLMKVIGGSSAGSAVAVPAVAATVDKEETIEMPGKNCTAYSPTEPLSMDILDAMSVHAKMSLTHSIVNHMSKQVSNKVTVALAPALVETYCRLLVYSEIESLGIKGLLNQLLPQLFKPSAWGILHVVLEMFSYRLHHIQAQFRLSLLSHLQMGLVTGSHTVINKHPQLNICVEATTLRLITGLGNAEISPPKAQPQGGQAAGKTTNVLYGESEELNRVVVLTLARAIHINGLEQQSPGWVKETLSNIIAKTPHSWPSHRLANFPHIIQDFYKEHPGPKDNKGQLKSTVEDEYKTWTSMTNEHDMVQHFAAPSNTLFMCVLWNMLLETDQISPIAYKVLERIGAKQLTAHLRSFCDLLVCEFSKSGGTGHVNKCIDALNNLIWKYNIIALDRLILCMALRTHEGNDAKICFFIIQLLLLMPQDFRDRVSELVKTMSPEHQVVRDFHSKHMEFHKKFPESFSPEDTSNAEAQTSPSPAAAVPTLPTYFGNVCLRFIPVFDIVVHGFLELPLVSKSLETLINHFGVLYKFHDRPISFLYNTLHYYEVKVRDRPSLKRKLVSSIVGALKDVRPPNWCLTEDYHDCLAKYKEDDEWQLGLDYYVRLVGRFTRSIQGKFPFPHMDWRFNEFPNEGAHALYVTCVEIMGLPIFDPAQIGASLVDVILEANHLLDPAELPDWINSVGLLLSNLPDAFSEGLTRRLVSALVSPPLSQWNLPQSPFALLNFDEVHSVSGLTSPTRLCRLLAVAHSIWHHSGFTQIQQLSDLVREKLLPVVRTEEQLIFIYHLAGPFLQRLHSERYVRPLFDLTTQLYRILGKVDKEAKHLRYMDAICDILYHVKYQFTGDSVRNEAERVVKDLRPALQLRLRFISPGIIQQQQHKQSGEASAVNGKRSDSISSR